MLLSGIVESKGGFPQRSGGGTIGLTQTISAALRQESATVVVDFALAGVGQEVEFEITRGDLGETLVEVWNANGSTPTKIKTVNWAGIAPPSNICSFTVDPSAIIVGGPLTSGLDEITDTEFYTSQKLDNDLAELQLQFDRARIAFSTTSDWANVAIVGGAEICALYLLETLGNPTRAEASSAEFALQQSLQSAKDGKRVGLTTDMILDISDGPTDFVISKGDLNQAILDVFNYNTSEPLLVRRVTHSGESSTSNPHNLLRFSLDQAAVASNGPLQVQKTEVNRMIWAFYYLWYNADDWNSPRLKDRPATQYESGDRNALLRHVEQAKTAGIDGFVGSWWGPHDYTDVNFRELLDVAAERSFWIMPYLETLQDPNQARPEQEITAWLEYLLREYGRHPAYFHLDDKPVVVIYSSDAVPLTTWRRVFDELKSKDLDALYVGMGLLDPGTLAVFDGLHDYGVAGQFRLGLYYQRAAKQVRCYSLLRPDTAPKIFAATLQPGYDDRSLPGREGSYWSRREGDSYRYTFEAARKGDPDWMFVTTWNEWWEHTYIEPSVQYGDLYLRLTKEFADSYKKPSE